MDKVKLRKKVYEILRDEILDLDIRDYRNEIMIDRIAELTVRICDRITDDDIK